MLYRAKKMHRLKKPRAEMGRWSAATGNKRGYERLVKAQFSGFFLRCKMSQLCWRKCLVFSSLISFTERS